MDRQIAYLEQFGNYGYEFAKAGVSSHYIIAAIIIDEPKVSDIESQIEKIRKQHFQQGELKSSNVANNHKRRKRILSELNLLPFHIYCFVVDKRKLFSNGLRSKDTFYKFLNGLVENKLFQAFPNLKICADEIGSDEFMNSFRQYVITKHIPDLFNNAEFGFLDSKSSTLIQLADFISGTIARGFDQTVFTNEGQTFFNIIRTHIIDIIEWPFKYDRFVHKYENGQPFNEIDKIISEQSVILARSFIKKYNKSKDSEKIDQVNTIKFLLFYFRYINSFRYVPTREIYQNLLGFSGSKMSYHYFRSKVIAKLRDNGVIVASSKNGYKLPAARSDLFEFINHSNQIIKPLLNRMAKCRDHIRLATKNRFDLFDKEEYVHLQKLFN